MSLNSTSLSVNQPSTKSISKHRQITLSESLASRIEEFLKLANGSGPKRVRAIHLIELGISKLEKSEIMRLRETKKSSKDRFEETFKEFQTGNPKATRSDFINYLLQNSASHE